MKKTISTVALGALLVSSIPVLFAQTSATSTLKKLDPVCLQNAVEKRDSAIISAITTQSNSSISALTARKTAVKAAFALPTRSEINSAKKAANENFEKTVKSIHVTMKNARNTAWTTYKTDARACGQTEIEKPVSIESFM